MVMTQIFSLSDEPKKEKGFTDTLSQWMYFNGMGH